VSEAGRNYIECAGGRDEAEMASSSITAVPDNSAKVLQVLGRQAQAGHGSTTARPAPCLRNPRGATRIPTESTCWCRGKTLPLFRLPMLIPARNIPRIPHIPRDRTRATAKWCRATSQVSLLRLPGELDERGSQPPTGKSNLRTRRALTHGVAPRMCGQVACPLLGGGAGGRSPHHLGKLPPQQCDTRAGDRFGWGM
jgi:hypothetical protein